MNKIQGLLAPHGATSIGDYTFKDGMLYLGASINAMPTSVYRSLHLGDLKPVGVVIHLANRSVAQLMPCLHQLMI